MKKKKYLTHTHLGSFAWVGHVLRVRVLLLPLGAEQAFPGGPKARAAHLLGVAFSCRQGGGQAMTSFRLRPLPPSDILKPPVAGASHCVPGRLPGEQRLPLAAAPLEDWNSVCVGLMNT